MNLTETNPEPARVKLDGVLTVRTIANTRASLLAALADHPAVLVDCAAAESVDLTFIQLLLAARLSTRQGGKPFSLAAPATGALRAALEQGGFLPPSGADPFWSGAA
jgi:anti-anti-sigma regulatory factor